MLYPIPMAFVMILVRFVVEKVVFRQIGLVLSLPNKRHPRPAANSFLESVYQGGTTLVTRELARKAGMQRGQVFYR